jgi:pyruvate kinase
MKIKIICTIGPSSSNKFILNKLKKLGVDIFRINLSHTLLSDLPKVIKKLKKIVGLNKICIDTEGAQLRTTKLKKKIFYKKNTYIKIFNNDNPSTKNTLSLYPKFNLINLPINAKFYVGFDGIILQVISKNPKKQYLISRVINQGYINSNKGVHVDKKISLDCLTKKDISAINYSRKQGITQFAMSFVNSRKDILAIRKIIGSECFLISKIETLNAISDLKPICNNSDAILIDRGDLSREIPIEKIPLIQERIVKLSRKNITPVFVATNLLETMIKETLPTRAESHDIYATLKQGASGLVLAAETAIGLNPINCVIFLKKCIKNFLMQK